MSIYRVHNTWFTRLKQLQPNQNISRIRNFAWLIAGIYMSQSVHLSRIANKMPGKAKLTSTVQKLRRLLFNGAIRVRHWYHPVAQMLITRQAQAGSIRLLVDGSTVGFSHQLLIVALAYRRRALPIAWTWVKSNRGHSSARKQLALLRYVHGLIPQGVVVSLAGDSEFGAIAVLRQLDAWHWHYVVRQKSSHWVSKTGIYWQQFGSLIEKPGQTHWSAGAYLTDQHGYQVNLLAHWEKGEKEPWLLSTNFSTPFLTLQGYSRRMWVEEMFGDFKGHGVDLQNTHLRHFGRLSRLMLAVALLYVFVIALGSHVTKRGERPLVDRNERRDLSIFRIGFYSLERYLANQLDFEIQLAPYF